MTSTSINPVQLLQRAISFASVSGNERQFTEFVTGWARNHDLEADLWESDERAIKSQGEKLGLSFARNIPLENRPTLVIRLAGNAQKHSLIFNAHADVVAAPRPEKWSHAPFAGEIDKNRIIGRGACDTKGPLVAALGAMLNIRARIPATDRGDILLELIPGEEDCVGLGTFTSVARGYRADGGIILEPTENIPCCASRGGTRFGITCPGRSVHGTVKWLGDDAIVTLRRVLDALESMEQKFNDRDADALFASYPIARPITVDRIDAGQSQGMICDRATCAGYFELLPADKIAPWQEKFTSVLQSIAPNVAVAFTESYDGHRLDADHALCRIAGEISECSPRAFNSGCEAGLRARLHNTPTLVWGPGNLAHAHAVDESIGVEELNRAADLFTELARQWCGMEKE